MNPATADECPGGNDVLLTRHGARIDNEDPRWLEKCQHNRSDDPHLSEGGIAAAKELAQHLLQLHESDSTTLTHIVSSPYVRCIETAHEIAKALKLSIKVESGIAEVNTSLDPGFLSTFELKKSFPSIDSTFTPVMNRGDLSVEYSDGAAAQRSASTARKIRQMLQGTILFVGHGASCLGIAGEFGHYGYVGYTSLTRFVPLPGGSGWKVSGHFGDVSHLSDKQTSLDSAW